MERIRANKNNHGITITDWLSSEEVKKLIKTLKKSKGWTDLTIVKNIDLKLDYYYINGDLVFKRRIK